MFLQQGDSGPASAAAVALVLVLVPEQAAREGVAEAYK